MTDRIQIRKSDNALMNGERVLTKLKSWKQANIVNNFIGQVHNDAHNEGIQEAIMYGDAFLNTIAHECGIDMAKFIAILRKHGVALAKK